jgi:ribosomal-protein-alanine N-acetyltransferase
MNYRLYQTGDFAQLFAIEEACFQPPLRFSRAYIRSLVTSATAATWVAEEQDALAGFAIVEWSQRNKEITAYVDTIEVLEAHRKQGIGVELLRRIEGSARGASAGLIWLHVDKENASAIRLYESCGYEAHGRQEGFYPNGNTALIYAKPLSSDI